MKIKNIKVKVAQREKEIVKISTPFITLDSAMKFVGIVGTGGQAKMLIQDDLVKVNGEVCEILRKKLYDGDVFTFENVDYEIKIHKED